jgi:uncharacterized protein (DUF488 family)
MDSHRHFITFGVYGQSEAQFFQGLRQSGIDLFVDLRARRGMRGSEYAFVNSKRLQERLATMGIAYAHASDLAPTPEIREAQKTADEKAGQAKRTRSELGPIFVQRFRSEVISRADWNAFDRLLGDHRVVGLFCVEALPQACHRSLVASYLQERGIGEVTDWFASSS